MNSCKYDGSISFFVPLAFFEGYFTHFQKFSMVFVFAKSTGSTKLMEWLAVKCWYLFAPIWLYAHHRSETLVCPGLTNSCMIGIKVLASRRATGTINSSLVVVSILPKTHCPQPTTSCISTIHSGPPICMRSHFKFTAIDSHSNITSNTLEVMLKMVRLKLISSIYRNQLNRRIWRILSWSCLNQ